MSARDRFQRLESLFLRALAAPPAQRAALLLHECGGDDGLHREISRLLADHEAVEQDTLLAAGAQLRADFEVPVAAEPLPERVGPFRILGEIAAGGFGRVLRAEDPRIGRHVAIKVLKARYARDAAARARLLEEGRLGGRLQHPSIVPVYEIGTTDGGAPFLCMKVVEGRTLASLLHARPDPTADRERHVAVFDRICQAIAYAHGRGVVHRDLKPHNVMVGEFGEVQVMDWGLAVVLGDERGDDARPVSGTPAYMAPEQASGDVRAIDRRTDVFGLGAVLCEILTGEPPYGGGDSATALARAKAADLQATRERLFACAGDDRGLAEIALRCLAPAPAERPDDATAVAAAIHRHGESRAARLHRAELEASSANARAASERRARRLAIALAVCVVAVALGSGATWLLLDQQERAQIAAAEGRLTGALLEAERRAAAAAAGDGDDLTAWESALLATQSAAALAAADVGPQLAARARELQRSVEQQTADLRFVRGMADAGSNANSIDSVDRRPAAETMRRLFRERIGKDVDARDLVADGAAAALAPIRWRERLINALDAWARIETEYDRTSPAAVLLRGVADRLDDDPWRRRVRAAIADHDRKALQELAHAPELDQATAASVRQLGLALLAANDLNTMSTALHRSLEHHPDDFDTLIDLCWLLLSGNEGLDTSDVERHARVALALQPNNPMPHEILARVDRRRCRSGDALVHADRAVELSPAAPEYRRTRALIRIDLGDFDGADADLQFAYANSPTSHTIRASLLAEIARLRARQGRIDEAVDLFVQSIQQPSSFPAYEVPFDDEDPTVLPLPALIARAERLSAAAPDDWVLHWLLGHLHEPLDLAAALRHYERLATAPPPYLREANSRILELRARSSGLPASHGSVESTVAALPTAVDAAAELQRFAPTLQSLRQRGEDGLAAHLEGLLLERADRRVEAAQCYRTGIAADRDAVELWQRLHACRAALDGRAAADDEIRALLRQGAPGPTLTLPLAAADLHREPPPANAEVRFAWTPHVVIDPRAPEVELLLDVHDAAETEPSRRPALGLAVLDDAGHVDLPRGFLRPGHDYVATARRQRNGREKTSPPSPPLQFHVDAESGVEVPIDLARLYDRDAIANPGDDADDDFDAKNSYRFTVDGYDGLHTDNDSVQGLPLDRQVGPFRLGDYSVAQAIGFAAARRQPLRIDLPPGHYLGVHFLVAAANGHMTLPYTVVYDGEDRPNDLQLIYIADWFAQDRPAAIGSPNVGVPVISQMDRMGRGALDERNGASLFDSFVALDPARAARAIVLLPADSRRSAPETTAMLFAVTAMRAPAAPR